MDNLKTEQYAPSDEAVATYLEESQEIFESYVKSLGEVESLQDLIDANVGITQSLYQALEVLKADGVPKH